MDIDLIAFAMKATTFLGVAACAAGLNLPTREGGGRRCLLMGLLGVALMFANAWIAPYPWAVLVGLAYLGACVALLCRVVLPEVATEAPAPLPVAA